MPRRPPLHPVPVALASLVLASGCYSTLLGRPSTPPGWEDAPRAGGGCPDLAGTFENRSRRTTRAHGHDDRPFQAPAAGRHLAALFGAVARPEAVERVTVSVPAPRVLRFLLEGPGGAQAIEVAERRDYGCDGGGAVFDGSAQVRRRGGGSLRLSRDAQGCLVVRARQRDGWGFLLVVPVLESVGAEWNRYCPPGRGGPPAAPVASLERAGEGRP